MGVDVQVKTEIRRPVAEVAAYAGDPGNAPTWYVNIREVTWLTEPPVAVGSRLDFVAPSLAGGSPSPTPGSRWAMGPPG